MMTRSVLNDFQMVDDTNEPDLDAFGHGNESGGSVPTNIESGSKETSTSTKTTGQSKSVKKQRKRMTPRSKVWTEGHFIPVKNKDGNVIKVNPKHSSSFRFHLLLQCTCATGLHVADLLLLCCSLHVAAQVPNACWLLQCFTAAVMVLRNYEIMAAAVVLHCFCCSAALLYY